jgi:hypothetical protein
VIVEFYDGPQATVLESDLVCLSQYREAYRQGWLDVSAGIKVTDWTWNPSPAYIMGYRAGRSDWYAGGAWYEAIKERCH